MPRACIMWRLFGLHADACPAAEPLVRWRASCLHLCVCLRVAAAFCLQADTRPAAHLACKQMPVRLPSPSRSCGSQLKAVLGWRNGQCPCLLPHAYLPNCPRPTDGIAVKKGNRALADRQVSRAAPSRPTLPNFVM